jgi:hypothetical protein
MSIAARPDCLSNEALTVRRKGRGIEVTVHREALLRQPRGWLTDFVDRAEAQGCIPEGQGAALAARILESVPLPGGAALRLLRADGRRDFVELSPGSRLQVISPIYGPGESVVDAATPMKVTGEGYKINVDLQIPERLLGVETAWYDLTPKAGGRGATIVFASAQMNRQGKTEDRAAPTTIALEIPAEMSYFRLFFKADQSEILGYARTHAGLPADADACGKSCFAIPRGVGVNPYMRILVNGVAQTVSYNATVRTALQAAKKRPEEVLATLAIIKPFGGKPVQIEFDRTKQEILNLALTGDEEIRW